MPSRRTVTLQYFSAGRSTCPANIFGTGLLVLEVMVPIRAAQVCWSAAALLYRFLRDTFLASG